MSSSSKPMGWLVGLGVLLITLGVIIGLIGIAAVARKRQQYRIVPTSNSVACELPQRAPPATIKHV